jgi:hypothetical protein
VLAGSIGEDLIHRDADIEPGFAGRRRHVREEPRAGFGVAPPGRSRVGRLLSPLTTSMLSR